MKPFYELLGEVSCASRGSLLLKTIGAALEVLDDHKLVVLDGVPNGYFESSAPWRSLEPPLEFTFPEFEAVCKPFNANFEWFTASIAPSSCDVSDYLTLLERPELPKSLPGKFPGMPFYLTEELIRPKFTEFVLPHSSAEVFWVDSGFVVLTTDNERLQEMVLRTWFDQFSDLCGVKWFKHGTKDGNAFG